MDIKIFKRLSVLFILPFMFLIACISLFISIPMWLFTGKEILNNVCDGMLIWVIKYLN